MTFAQRSALVGMCDAVLACDCATDNIRLRAEKLRARLTHDFSRIRFGVLFVL